MYKINTAIIKCALVLLLCGTVALFICWVPFLHEYVQELLANRDKELGFLCSLVYPIAALIALPAVATIVIAFRFPTAIVREEIFSNSTAKNLTIISALVSIACIIGLLSSLLLFLIGDRVLSPLLFFAFLVGCTLGIMLDVLARYVRRAAILKEEADHTL